MKLSGRAAIESALSAVGERLAHAQEPCAIVVLGGAAMNLLGIVSRPTNDVGVLARADASGAIGLPAHCRTRCGAQDTSPGFHEVVGKVVAYVQGALR